MRKNSAIHFIQIISFIAILLVGCYPPGTKWPDDRINRSIRDFFQVIQQKCQDCSSTKLTIDFGGFTPCPSPCPAGSELSKDQYILRFFNPDGNSAGRFDFVAGSTSFELGGNSNCAQVLSLLGGGDVEIWQPTRWICNGSFAVSNECKYRFVVPPVKCNAAVRFNIPLQPCKCN